MGDIIRGWILRQLGSSCWDENLDGRLIARILHSYALLSQEQLDIILDANHPLNSPTIEVMRHVIQKLHIEMPSCDFQEVLDGRKHQTTKLLYEMYVVLHERDLPGVAFAHHLNDPQATTRFTVSAAESKPEIEKFTNPLAAPLKGKNEIIVYHIEKHLQLMQKCEKARQEYIHLTQQRKAKMPTKFHQVSHPREALDLPDDAESVDQSFTELIKEAKEVMKAPKLIPDKQIANEIIKGIHAKSKKMQKDKEVQKKGSRIMLSSVWQNQLQEQEDYFKKQFAKMLQQKSNFEQQLTASLLETRQNKDIIIEEKRALLKVIEEEKAKRRNITYNEDMRKDGERAKYYLELHRKNALHRKIYDLKVQQRRHKAETECKSIVSDILDMAIYTCDYHTMHDVEMPRREQNKLAKLFIAKEPIFLETTTTSGSDIQLDIGKCDRSAVDVLSLEDYLLYYWPWDFSSWMEFDGFSDMTLGLNVLGHIVHRLLAGKHPPHPLPTSPPIPKTSIAACVVGFNNLSLIPQVIKEMHERKIHVFLMKDAFDYCIDIFQRNSRKEGQDPSATTTPVCASGSRVCVSLNDNTLELVDSLENTDMTPVACTCTKKVNSASIVGKEIYDIIKMGQTPNEVVNANAVVEYLKNLKLDQLNGWVLINYPQTYTQAIALEEALSCVRVPFLISDLVPDDMDDIIHPVRIRVAPAPSMIEVDKDVKRKSRLLKNPRTIYDDALKYDTFLSGFIEMKTTDSSINDCFKSEKNMAALAKFYADQECRHTLFYKSLDSAVIEELCKLILSPKSPKETNAVTILNEIAKPSTEDLNPTQVKEKSKSKKAKKEGQTDTVTTKSTKSKKKRVSKEEIITGIDKQTQIPTPKVRSEVVIVEPEAIPKPGEYHWRYFDLPINENIEVALATLWEHLEEGYLANLKYLFKSRRIQLDSLMPYNTLIKRNMLSFIGRPDRKQQHLHDFQMCYNEFDDDMREDDEVKAELHMRIEEFREKLWKICDTRQLESEEERVRIIQENWTSVLLTELTNIFIAFVQVEMDRSTDTIQLILDYYSTLLTGGLTIANPLTKSIFQRIKLPQNLEDMDHLAPYNEFVEEKLRNANSDLKSDMSPFVRKMELILREANVKVLSNLATCSKQLNVLKKQAGKQHITHEHLLEEMEAVAHGEQLRIELQLKILEQVFVEEVQDMLDKVGGNFHSLYEAIRSRYSSECNAVLECTKLLKRAVEEEVSIQPELLFVDDMFYVHLGCLLYETPLPDIRDVRVREPSDSEYFTVEQLIRITDILFQLSPNGIIGERPFAYLLQEFITYQEDNGEANLVPDLWRTLEPHKTHELMRRLFGDTEYIDWKDFIIYSLHVPFPSEEEILDMRGKFRRLDPDMTELIPHHLFPGLTFWFEADMKQPRLRNTRDLLLKLFSFDEQLNYTALLLAFCKDSNPIMGFVKALEVSLGKPVCYDEVRGSAEYAKALRSIMKKEILSIVRQIEEKDMQLESDQKIDKMIEDTLSVQMDSSVLEIMDEDESLERLSSRDIVDYLQKPVEERITITDVVEDMSIISSEMEQQVDELETSTPQTPRSSPGLVYVISFDVIINVLSVMLPWIHKITRFGELTFHEHFALVYNSLINADVRTAFIYQILMNPNFYKIFVDIYKFYDRDPVQIVKELLMED